MAQPDLASLLAGASIASAAHDYVSSVYAWSGAIVLALFLASWAALRRTRPGGVGAPTAPAAGLRLSRATWLRLAAWVAASVGGGLLLTLLLRWVPVDVGLELAGPLKEAPALCVRGSDGAVVRLGDMEKVPERLGQEARPFIEVRATGDHNPESRGARVRIEPTHALNEWVQDPPGSWLPGAEGRLGTTGEVPATIRGEALLGREIEICLGKGPFAGIAEVRTAEGLRIVNLYAPQADVFPVKVPGVGRSQLYYGRVARRDLPGVVLRFAPASEPQIVRLYVGTLLPTIATPPSGLPEVTWGRTVGNWSTALRDGTLALPKLPAWESAGAATFVLLTGLLLGVLGLAGGWALDAGRAVLRFRGQPLPDLPVAEFRWRRLLAFWAPAFVYWGFWLLMFYPGVLNSDTVDQWNQAKTGVYCDHHPAVLAFGIAALTRLWDSPAIVALAQILTLSLALALGADFLWRLGIRRAAVLGAYLVTLLSPKNGNYAVAILKDVPFAAATLGACVLLAELLVSAPLRRKVWPWVALGLVLAGCRLVRHNGSAVLYPVLLVVAWVFGREYLRRVVLTAVVAVLAIVGVRGGLYSAMGVPAYEFNAGLMAELTRMGAVVHQRAPLSASEATFLDKVRSFDDGWAYDSVSMGGVFYTVAHPLDWGLMIHRRAEFDRLFLSLAARNPLVYVRHSVKNLDYLFAPVAHEKTPIQAAMWETSDTMPLAQQWGLKTASLWPGAYALVARTLRMADSPRWTWLFWRPTLSIYASVAAAIVLLWRKRDWRYLLVFLPALLVLPSLVMAFVQCVRFVLPTTFAAPFLVCLAFLPGAGAPAHIQSPGGRDDDESSTCVG